jgi:hypothetical protein
MFVNLILMRQAKSDEASKAFRSKQNLLRQAKLKLAGGKSRRQELTIWQDDRELAEIEELIP